MSTPTAEPQSPPLSPAILIVGAAVTPAVMERLKQVDPVPQVQTYRFHWAVIHALEAGTGGPIDICSTVPIRDFPYGRKLFWGLHRERRQVQGREAWLTLMPFINCLGLKQLTRLLSCLWFTLAWLWRRRREEKAIVLYGLIVSHLYAVLPLAKLAGVKVLAIVTDGPTPRLPDESWLYGLARLLDRSLLKRSLHSLDGIVVLAAGAAKLLAPGVPALVLEGIISDEVTSFAQQQPPPRAPDAPFAIMYAGQIESAYGIDLLLAAFRELEGPQWALWVFGRGRMAPAVEDAAAHDPRITYFGFQSNEVLFDRMAAADVLVSPRPLDDTLTPFLFPSKVLEYMAMGKVVVSSRLPGIPEEYYPYLVIVDNLSPATLAAQIRAVAGWAPEHRAKFEEQVRTFVWSSKTTGPQGRRFCQFIRALSG